YIIWKANEKLESKVFLKDVVVKKLVRRRVLEIKTIKGCLKRYCDCFQNGVRCTDACRCIGCKNYDGSEELNKLLEKGVNVNQRHFLRQGYTVSPSRKQVLIQLQQ